MTAVEERTTCYVCFDEGPMSLHKTCLTCNISFHSNCVDGKHCIFCKRSEDRVTIG